MRSYLEKARDIMATGSRFITSTATTSSVLSCPTDIIKIVSSNENMRGLFGFISRIRNSTSREDEEKIINQELANIRSKFKNPIIDCYSKKKYVCKLLYIFLLGRKIDFGFSEALSLLSSNLYSEKRIGYLFLSFLFDLNRDISNLLIKCIGSDLESSNMNHVNLALQCIASLGNEEMLGEFLPKIFEFIENSSVSRGVKQSAILCFLKLYKSSGTSINPVEWFDKLIYLLVHQDLGVVMCSTPLIDAFIKHCPLYKANEVLRIIITELWRIVTVSRPGLTEYKYYNSPSPWLVVNLLRLLQNFGVPSEQSVCKLLENVLKVIFDNTEEPFICTQTKSGKETHALNAKYAVFFEAIAVVSQNTTHEDLRSRTCQMVGLLLNQGTINIKYLTLEAMSILAVSESCRSSMKTYLNNAARFLECECDVSLQQRAVDFLYSISDPENVNMILQSLLEFLTNCEYSIKESVALQIAVIAEQCLPDYTSYVTAQLKLLSLSDDLVHEQVGPKVLQVIVDQPQIQKYAAKTVFNLLNVPLHEESIIRIAGFVLGEYGHLINDDLSTSVEAQMQLLKSKYSYCKAYTKSVLLSGIMKLAFKFPQVRPQAREIFMKNICHVDIDIQQRSVEYVKFLDSINEETLSIVFTKLPPLVNFVQEFGSLRNNAPVKLNLDRGDTDHINLLLKDTVGVIDNGIVSNDETYRGYVILYDDELIRICVKNELRGSSAQLEVSYKNKSSSIMKLETIVRNVDNKKLAVETSPIDCTLTEGSTIHQTMSIVCFDVFDAVPKLQVSFNANSLPKTITISLPIGIHSYLEPTSMSKEMFFQRWESLQHFPQDSPVVKAKGTVNHFAVKSTLINMNLEILENVDADPNHFSCAAMFCTKSRKIGCLVRLESSPSTNKYCITVRTPHPLLTNRVTKILTDIL